MSRFSVCTLGKNPVLKYYHDYGEFDFYIIADPKDPKKLTYAASAKLTEGSGKQILSEALTRLKEFSAMCGYADDTELTMYDILKIMSKAQEFK